MTQLQVPFFRVEINDDEINEVVSTLRSGWLTTGAQARRFEQEFAAAVGAAHAVSLNSCTAALHLAVEALKLGAGQAVLVPTMTFAATAEIVRYLGAILILVDCDPQTTNIDLHDAANKIEQLRRGRLLPAVDPEIEIVGIIPVHVSGMMIDLDALQKFAREQKLWVVEDAAHAFPAAWRKNARQPWQSIGSGNSEVTCFSFYANKTITTGEGGMAVTNHPEIAERIRLMSLHGLSNDAWTRYSGVGAWDYKIIAPGYKYNLTDIAAALGIHQLARAERMRSQREEVARIYNGRLSEVEEIELPPVGENRLHSWHLYPIKLKLDRLSIDRNNFMEELKRSGVGCSVHWRPLHLHPYYQNSFKWQAEDLPVATKVWERLISLPLFSSMNEREINHVVATVKDICHRYVVRKR